MRALKETQGAAPPTRDADHQRHLALSTQSSTDLARLEANARESGAEPDCVHWLMPLWADRDALEAD